MLKFVPTWANTYNIPTASGIMAGEALMGCLISLLASFGVIPGP